MNSDVSGMNFAKFNLDKANFNNSITCETIFPWGKNKEEMLEKNKDISYFLLSLINFFNINLVKQIT